MEAIESMFNPNHLSHGIKEIDQTKDNLDNTCRDLSDNLLCWASKTHDCMGAMNRYCENSVSRYIFDTKGSECEGLPQFQDGGACHGENFHSKECHRSLLTKDMWKRQECRDIARIGYNEFAKEIAKRPASASASTGITRR